MLQVLAPNGDGDLFLRPLEWHGEGPEPRVLYIAREAEPALGEGDRVLARLTHVGHGDHAYEARLIRRIGTNPRRILGIYRKGDEGGRIVPIDKKSDREWRFTGEVMDLIPLRNRRQDPDGNWLMTRISEGMTRWTVESGPFEGRTGYGLSEYLDQIIDGAPVGLAE